MKRAALTFAVALYAAGAQAQSTSLPEGLEGLGSGAGPILEATSAAAIGRTPLTPGPAADHV